MNKKAFTLVEILTVLVLIWILWGIGIRYLSSGNFSKQQSAGVECWMYLNQEINSFVDTARKSSGLITKIEKNKKLTKIYPEKYGIHFTGGTMQLYYQSGSSQSNYRDNYLQDRECTPWNYNIKFIMTGDITWKDDVYLDMNAWFLWNKPGEISTFKILDKDKKSIWGKNNIILLKSCKEEYCIDVYRFQINIATQKINSQICRSYLLEDDWTTKRTCKKWR